MLENTHCFKTATFSKENEENGIILQTECHKLAVYSLIFTFFINLFNDNGTKSLLMVFENFEVSKINFYFAPESGLR